VSTRFFKLNFGSTLLVWPHTHTQTHTQHLRKYAVACFTNEVSLSFFASARLFPFHTYKRSFPYTHIDRRDVVSTLFVVRDPKSMVLSACVLRLGTSSSRRSFSPRRSVALQATIQQRRWHHRCAVFIVLCLSILVDSPSLFLSFSSHWRARFFYRKCLKILKQS